MFKIIVFRPQATILSILVEKIRCQYVHFYIFTFVQKILIALLHKVYNSGVNKSYYFSDFSFIICLADADRLVIL